MAPTNSEHDIKNLLRAGIAAAKAGQKEEAHKFLMDVLRANDRNETAWLWLSGVVASNDERRICLENVLTLNPGNQTARRGLEKLAASEAEAASQPTAEIPPVAMEEKVIRREFAPFSPASAILYPERQVQEVRWQEPVVPQKAAQAEIRAQSSYDDVWSRNEDICAFCAHPVTPDDAKCPKCGHNLMRKRFTYEKPTSSTHVYWVLLVGLGQLFLIEAIVLILVGKNYLAAGGYGVLLLIFWGLAVGVYFRQSWAHLMSIIGLLLVLFGFLLTAVVDVDFSRLGLAVLDESIQNFISPFVGGLLDFLKVFEVATAVLGLFYGIFKAGPDFERIETQMIATVTKGRRTAADYHNIARQLSGKGMWASAALHWQRAAAQEPGQVTYQKQLGLAYARLGFYQRSLDVLQSAFDMSTHPPTKKSLAQQIDKVKERLAAGN